MRVVHIGVLLALGCSVAQASWFPVAAQDHAKSCVEPTSTERSGHLVKVVVMIDLDRQQPTGGKLVSSLELKKEFNCKNEKQRTLSSTAFSGRMGGGRPLISIHESESWDSIIPGSMSVDEFKFACTF